MLSNRNYDLLKKISIIIVPFCGVICSLIKLFQSGADAVTIVMAIGSAIAEVIGIILEVSSKRYWQEQTEEGEG